MAKVKSKLFDAIHNPLAGRGHTRARLTGLNVGFYTHDGTIVMRAKPKSPPRTSEAQLHQQELWKDGDCMWKFMTLGQKILWGNFYAQEFRAGRTLKTEATKRTQAGQQIPAKDMGTVSLFMSHALRLDLLDYLQNFLLSWWEIYSIADTGTTWLVTAGLSNPPELTEASILQEPKPVRGWH